MPRPKVAGDMFGDLLGTQGFDFSSSKKDSGPRTINAMRKEEMAKDMDPDKLKVTQIEGSRIRKKVGKGSGLTYSVFSFNRRLWNGRKENKGTSEHYFARFIQSFGRKGLPSGQKWVCTSSCHTPRLRRPIAGLVWQSIQINR